MDIVLEDFLCIFGAVITFVDLTFVRRLLCGLYVRSLFPAIC